MGKNNNLEMVIYLLAVGGVLGVTLLYAVDDISEKGDAATNTNDLVTRVTCYSGPLKIFDDFTNSGYGRIGDNNYDVEGYNTGKTAISGATTCVTNFNATIPEGFKPTLQPDGIQFDNGKSQNPTNSTNKVPKPNL